MVCAFFDQKRKWQDAKEHVVVTMKPATAHSTHPSHHLLLVFFGQRRPKMVTRDFQRENQSAHFDGVLMVVGYRPPILVAFRISSCDQSLAKPFCNLLPREAHRLATFGRQPMRSQQARSSKRFENVGRGAVVAGEAFQWYGCSTRMHALNERCE